MAFQDRKKLAAAAIGIEDGNQPIEEAPTLDSGIHLRWGPGSERTLPYGGYYLLRRETPAERREGRLFDLFSARRTTAAGESLETDQAVDPLTGETATRTRLTFPPESYLTAVELVLSGGNTRGLTVVATTDEAPVDADRQPAGVVSQGTRLRVEADRITGLVAYGDVSVVQVAVVETLVDDLVTGWNFLSPDTAPLALPLTHPDYPAATSPESLDDARAEAASRISYGDPGRLTTDEMQSRPGTVEVEHGSPIVRGSGTDWSRQDAGATFRVADDDTAYTVLEVLDTDSDGSADRLLLSRAYEGTTTQGLPYRLGPDPFGDLHDALAASLDGGLQAGGMHARRRPAVVFDAGTVTRRRGESEVVGKAPGGTAPGWTDDLLGLSLHVARPSGGTVEVQTFETEVQGTGTDWDDSLEGRTLRFRDEQSVYTIERVVDETTLELDRPYLGRLTGGQRKYEVYERSSARIRNVFPPEMDPDAPTEQRQRLELAEPHRGETHADGRRYVITGALTATAGSADDGAESGSPVEFPSQYLVESVLLGSLDPAMAQLLGLYWLDDTAQKGVEYDYMVVADHAGIVSYLLEHFDRQVGPFNFAQFVSFVIQLSTEGTLDSYLLPGKRLEDSPGPAPPTDVRSYPLPEGAAPRDADDPTRRFSVGLRWDRSTVAPDGPLSSTGPVVFNLWRYAYDGPPDEQPPAATAYDLVGRGGGVADDVTAARREVVGDSAGANGDSIPGWPDAGVYALDTGRPPGWHSYRVSGTDLFGRHTPRSEPAAWFDPATDTPHQLEPPVDPPHLIDVPEYAVELRGRSPPPPPTNVRAEVLDPTDPNLSRGAYEDWLHRTGRSAEDEPIGLRVRWEWTERAANHSPEVSGFEVHYLPGRPDTVTGRTAAVEGAGDARTVRTDVTNTVDPDDPSSDRLADDSYVGATLRVDGVAFAVLGSRSGIDPGTEEEVLVLDTAVATTGSDQVEPATDVDFSLNVPATYSLGQATVTHGSATVTGEDTAWVASLEGEVFRLGTDQTPYVVQSVTDATTLELDRPVDLPAEIRRNELVASMGAVAEGVPESDLDVPVPHTAAYAITHPLASDLTRPGRWPKSVTTVGRGEWVEEPSDTPAGGNALPRWAYEVVVPAPGLDFEGDHSLIPTLADPVAHGSVGVNAFTDRVEGGVGGPAPVHRVFRDDPDPPTVPELPSGVDYATEPDYDGKSYYTVRWLPPGPNRYTHVYRALDESLFRADWERRKAAEETEADRYVLTPEDESRFPETLRGSGVAEVSRREEIARALEDDLHRDGDPENPLMQWTDALEDRYRKLEPDALQVLAGLPGIDGAYTRITTDPLAAADHPNVVGPDFEPGDPGPDFQPGSDEPPDTPDGSDLCAYVDSFDGRSTNRYCYRCGTVDAAGNLSSRLSYPTPPVQSRNGVPPAKPTFGPYECLDGAIKLTWSQGRTEDLRWYRIYRSSDGDLAGDVRRMDLVDELEIGVDVPTVSEEPTVEFVDDSTVGGVEYHYRLVEVDGSENVSEPSSPLVVTAVDTAPPKPPVWLGTSWILREPDGTEVEWNHGDPVPGDAELVVRLEWSGGAEGERYRVSRRPRGGVGWRPLDGEVRRVDGERRYAYVDETADRTTTYTYRLRAESAAGVPATEHPEIDVGRAQVSGGAQ